MLKNIEISLKAAAIKCFQFFNHAKGCFGLKLVCNIGILLI